jgi:nicotinamidase-related amidase
MLPSMSGLAPVIVIDLQTAMFDGTIAPPIHDAEGLTARARAVIEWARAMRRKVAFVRHDGEPHEHLAPGKPGWHVWPALGQAGHEPTFSKSVGDAFSNVALGKWVFDQGAGEVVLLGAQTDHCVAASVTGAIEAGFAVTVVADAHGTWDWAGETAPQIIARHNALFEAAGARVVTTQVLIAG